jgi:hypothetical protein
VPSTRAAEDFSDVHQHHHTGILSQSTEGSATDAWALGFNDGEQGAIDKTFILYVRAFRKFAL